MSQISTILENVDRRRISADREISPTTRSKLGQFMTPAPLARFMASLFRSLPGEIKLLDPGAGIGTLTSAFVEYAVRQIHKPSIDVHAYEIDATMRRHLEATLGECGSFCRQLGADFQWQIHVEDFIEAGVQSLLYEHSLFGEESQRYTHCIMNPPYRKIKSDSGTRVQLQRNGPKPNAIAASRRSLPWLMPNAWYVLLKRFSAKEEKRRIVASVYDPNQVPGSRVGFENHLNVIHMEGGYQRCRSR